MNYQLTSSQKNIWNLQKYFEDTTISTICGAIFYGEKIESDLIQRALNIFLQEQDSLRLRFYMAEQGVRQFVSEYEKEEFPVKEFISKEEYLEYVDKEKQIPFQIENGKMYRFIICQFRERTSIFMVLNHLVADAWSIGLLGNRVSEIVSSILEKEDIIEKKYSYIDNIETEENYLQSKKFAKDEEYWHERYDENIEPAYIKPERQGNTEVFAKRFEKRISGKLSQQIKDFCEQNQLSPAILFESMLYIYIGKINPQNPFVTIGSLVLNRVGKKDRNTAGMFISTLPLTVQYDDNKSVYELCEEVTKRQMECFRHQRYPYAKIQDFLHREHQLHGNLYDVLISFQNTVIKSDIPFYTEWYSNGYSEVALALHIDDRDGKGDFHITIDYQTDVFKTSDEVALVYDRLVFILQQMLENGEQLLKKISILPVPEINFLLNKFNATNVKYEKDKCVHELFMEQVKNAPEQVALVFENRRFTYQQIDQMSNSLAYALRSDGIGREDVVPIIAVRSWHIIVAMIGCMKAGAAFLSIDPKYPFERIEFMLRDANCKSVLTYNYLSNNCIKKYKNYDLANFDFSKNVGKISNINHPEDLCYVIYTSGSTGNPKGLCISHNNIINFVNKNKYNVYNKIIKEKNEKFLSITNTIFDMFITELMIPLTSGMTLILANENETVISKDLNQLCESSLPTIMETTPTKLKMLLDDGQFSYIHNFKEIIVGGEELTAKFYLDLKEKTSANIFNNYGPAETTVWSTITLVSNDDITIGKPIANTQIYILDCNYELVPIGVPGEICIAGDGVGLGYLNRPDLTAERFVPNPFATEENHHGKTMYKTGDLAAWNSDGNILYLGRIDTQVKIRGLRIELGEIESVMSEFPGIRMCAVADKKSENGRQYLVGYYNTVSDEKEKKGVITTYHLDEKALREYLLSKLPQYMVPNYFMHLKVFPMTAGGKLDRKNLQLPSDFSLQTDEYIAPYTEMQEILCRIVCEILDIKNYGISQDFFECGGDSLSAIEFVVHAEKQGIPLKLQMVFDYPTIEGLASVLENIEIKKKSYQPEHFKKYENLFKENRVKKFYNITEKKIHSVLLTGVTGFLGVHILDELLSQVENCVVYCLVRGTSEVDRRGKLLHILKYYFDNKYEDEVGKRIVPVIGDIIRENVSDDLPANVDMVIHSAASVKHFGKYEYFYQVNTLGTKNVAEYAKKVGAKFIYISTISVSGNGFVDVFNTEKVDDDRIFTERSLYQGQTLENVYVRSKFEAECMVLDYMLEGLKANIIRVGNLTNRSGDYKFQSNYTENAFLSRVKAFLDFGYMPDYLLPLYSEFSPVDDTAKAIVKIAKHFNQQYTVFHVNSDRRLYFHRLVEILKELQIPMEVVSGDVFIKKLRDMMATEQSYIYEAFINDLDQSGKLAYDSNIRIENDFTLSYLKELGFEWTEIDLEYVKGYVEWFKNLRYLE